MPIRVLGPVVSVTPSRLVVVKIDNPQNIPRISTEVVDAQGEVIGHIVDIIGPVSSPYAVIKLSKPALVSFVKPSIVLFYRYVFRKKRKRRYKK